MPPIISPFFDPGSRTSPNSLALVHLSRDNLQPVYLQATTSAVDGYAEGAVLNTRFGSFPHSTLLNVPWGSQVRASKVDTGSRGRHNKKGAKKEAASRTQPGGDAGAQKRKRPEEDEGDRDQKRVEVEDAGASDAQELGERVDSAEPAKQAVQASSGFIHVLPPTPELWTVSLPHRTQVVYTPDYSYILHRIRARPGSRIIEAGSGSGSFTHASARAVYNGYPRADSDKKGKVISFEFHEQRHEKMTKEIQEHGLEGLVQLTHRDVYQDGFLLDGKSPEADAVFLDLPAPWLALPHLSRRKLKKAVEKEVRGTANTPDLPSQDDGADWVSPLNPKKSVYLCTFSPCIEQVTRTVSALRTLGWVEIDMVEIAHKKLYVSREKIGFDLATEKGANQSPRDVAQAVSRLKQIENRFKEYHATQNTTEDASGMDLDEAIHANQANGVTDGDKYPDDGSRSKEASLKPFMQGRIIHRAEPETKTHTSYLVFAVLPREWTEEDEAAAFAKWPVTGKEKGVIGSKDKKTRKQEKRELLMPKKERKGREAGNSTSDAKSSRAQ